MVLTIFIETQIASADNIETTEHALQKSLRVMRGMTWSGMLYNAFTRDPTPEVTTSIQRPSVTPLEGPSDTRRHYENRSELLHGSSAETKKDGDIEQLAHTVNQVESISLAIQESLKAQNTLTEDMNDKTEEVHRLALASTLRAAQLTQRSRKSAEVLLGEYYFEDPRSGHFLSVDGISLVLSPVFDRAAVFRIFAKESHLMGLQSCKTFKFLGVNVWGAVAVSGNYFGSYEETFVDVDGVRNTPGILLLVSNWGGGGWLQEPIPSGHKGSQSCQSVTSGISDSTRQLRVKAKPMTEEHYRQISATEK